jgi:hypothetical protein
MQQRSKAHARGRTHAPGGDVERDLDLGPEHLHELGLDRHDGVPSREAEDHSATTPRVNPRALPLVGRLPGGLSRQGLRAYRVNSVVDTDRFQFCSFRRHMTTTPVMLAPS